MVVALKLQAVTFIPDWAGYMLEQQVDGNDFFSLLDFEVGLNVWQRKQKKVIFSQLCLFVGRLVCRQDYTKTSQQISTKLGWTMGLVPE